MTVKFNWVSQEADDATVHVAHTPYGDLIITEDKGVPWLHIRALRIECSVMGVAL